MTKNTRKQAAQKAVKTKQVRRAFVEQFGQDTFDSLRDIVNGVDTNPRISRSTRRSFAAYKANLTRGTYRKWIRTNRHGEVVVDKLGLVRG